MARSILKALQFSYRASLRNDAKRFSQSLSNPQLIQNSKLQSTLSKNSDSVYGKKFGFSQIDSVKAFQSKVPIVDYDELEPYIDNIKAGYKNVLTCEPTIMLERSGGSTSTTKYIPYSQSLLNEFSAATNAWLFDLYRNNSKLNGTEAYWSVSPISQDESESIGGVPIGFEDETEYFNPLARWALNQMFAVPASVRKIKDDLAWQEATALYLLKSRNLGIISVWSPTFLSVLMRYISDNWRSLLNQLPAKRRCEVAASRDNSSELNGELIWPCLSVISCWSDGISRDFCQNLRTFFPTVFIQGKGILATEGVVSIPWLKHSVGRKGHISHGGVVAINSHFYEFIDLNDEKSIPKTVSELKPGAEYSPILTTAGGLYRYQLKDIIRCCGFSENTPEIEFVNKLDRVSDFCGEKINANQVDFAVDKAITSLGIDVSFLLLSARHQEPLYYTLFVDSNEPNNRLQQFSRSIESYLKTGHHYQHCLSRGQLLPMRVKRIKNGWKQYQSHLLSQGQRLGDIKPTRLDARFDWHNIFIESRI